MEAHALMLVAPNQLMWQTEQLSPPQADQLLVRSCAGAISMGTELALYRGATRQSLPLHYPLMTGYETIAEVLACGANVRHVAVGDRIVAFYGHRTHAVIPASRAIRIPPDISDALALLVILGCETAKGIAKVVVEPHERVLITGAGTIGLLTLFNLRAHGIATIDIVEPAADRHDLARRLGARRVGTPGELAQQAAAYHAGFECSSLNAAFALLQQLLLPHGRLCVLADARQDSLVLTPAFHEKELQIVGSSDGEDYAGYAAWYWPHVRHDWKQLAQLFWHSVAFDDLPEAFADMAGQAVVPVKVLVRYPRSDIETD